MNSPRAAMLKYLPALLLLAALALGQTTTDGECGPIDGICDITLESLVEVSFYDVNDPYGCQIECDSLQTCNYYSQFVDTYDPTLAKCLLFETCSIIDPCDECTTNPKDPDSCLPTSTTCTTDKDNVVDLFYFSKDDFYNCEQKCVDIADCHYWSQFLITTLGSSVNKCFLFRDCQNTEPCIDCITGSVDP